MRRNGKCDPQSREKEANRNQFKVQMELAGKNFKVAVIDIFIDLKENIMNTKKARHKKRKI